MKLSFDCPAGLLTRLEARYGEPHRRYHVWGHVLACFAARDLIAEASPATDLALLFHDAIYDPLAHDNEERSAELLAEEGRYANLDERWLAHGCELVLATKHDRPATSDDAGIVVDADLSILGADVATFDAYETAVRAEYAFVDDAAFSAGRSRIVAALLARPFLFATPRARALWEVRARENLARSHARWK